MDDKLQYHVWAEDDAGRWSAVTTLPLSQSTAETLAKLLAHERKIPHDQYKFSVSIHRPLTMVQTVRSPQRKG